MEQEKPVKGTKFVTINHFTGLDEVWIYDGENWYISFNTPWYDTRQVIFQMPHHGLNVHQWSTN